MTLFLVWFTTTAPFFVAFIWALWRLVGRENELRDARAWRRQETSELRDECDALRKTLGRVAEAIAIERAAGDELRRVRKELYEHLNDSTIPFMDAFLAEYGIAATNEPEEE